MKITFSKSDPFHQGWRGWSDYVDIIVDGQKIGDLAAIDCNVRSDMEYGVRSDHPKLAKLRLPYGTKVREAKRLVREALTKGN